MDNNFTSIAPCETLKKYVACYYFIESDDPAFESKHYSFPHIYNSLSIYKNSEISCSNSLFSVAESAEPNYRIFIQQKQQVPLLVHISGRVHRITILFKDFCINHFISESLNGVMGQNNKYFKSWINDALFPDFASALFAAKNNSSKKEMLDQFLLHRLVPLDLSNLQKAVTCLCDTEFELSIKEIATAANMPLRSFNRQFKDTLGVSPIEYRRIAQFRRSMNDKLFVNQFQKLTQIGYNNNFYDQSYFIKMYKKLTGSNPTAFFRKVEKLGEDQLILQFIKKWNG